MNGKRAAGRRTGRKDPSIAKGFRTCLIPRVARGLWPTSKPRPATRARKDAGEPRKKNGDEKCFEDLVHSRGKREAATPGLGGLPARVSIEGGDQYTARWLVTFSRLSGPK